MVTFDNGDSVFELALVLCKRIPAVLIEPKTKKVTLAQLKYDKKLLLGSE